MAKGITLDDLKDEQTIATPEEEVPTPAETPEETPKEEPPKEEPEAVPSETPPETPPETPEEPAAEEPKTTGIDLSFINNKFNKKFESEDDLLAELNKPTKELELKEASDKLEDLTQKYEILLEQTDPATLFSSDAAMKLEVWKKSNPKKDAAIAQKIFASDDLDKASDLELVKMGHRFNNTRYKGSDSALEAMIADEFGVDADTPFNEWPATAQSRLSMKAGEYLNQFDQEREGVEVPERINIENIQTERQTAYAEKMAAAKEGWEANAETTLAEVKKISLPVGTPKEGESQKFFEWELGELPRAEVDAIKQDFISRGLDNNDTNKATFKKALDMALLDKNLPLILQKYGDDLLARQAEKHIEETHNPEPLSDSQRADESSEEKDKKERSEHATEGLGGGFQYRPLFTVPKKE